MTETLCGDFSDNTLRPVVYFSKKSSQSRMLLLLQLAVCCRWFCLHVLETLWPITTEFATWLALIGDILALRFCRIC
jgi:hypothetical protein